MNLLCCPFCTSMPAVEMAEIENGAGQVVTAYVICDACIAHGPEADTVELAAEFWNKAHRAPAQQTRTLTLLSPSNLPMENDPDVLLVARAIAERGIGRYWDDFPETDAFDTDQGDLIEYARAAVEIFRRSAPAVTSTDG